MLHFISGRMLAIGLVMGPPHHYWYLWLDRYLKQTQVWSKILADQILAAPFFAFGFFYGMGFLEGHRVEESTAEFKSKFLTVYAVRSVFFFYSLGNSFIVFQFDWLFWPPSQYVNFHYVPATYRVLYVNGATVVWDVFLSYMKHHVSTVVNKFTALTDKVFSRTKLIIQKSRQIEG
jgi:protein Mpv17